MKPNSSPQFALISPETETEEAGDLLTIPQPGGPTAGGSGFRVILYNDEHHGMDEVIEQIIKATGCEVDEAIRIMLEAHQKGRAVCFKGSRQKCQKVARVLREIRLQCEVDCD